MLLYRISLFNRIGSPIIITTFTRVKAMTRLRPPLSAITAIVLLSGAFLLGSSVVANSCPSSAFDGSGGIGSPRNANSSDGAGGSQAFLRQPDQLDRSVKDDFTGDSKRLNVTGAEIVGFGAVVGLFAIAIFCKVRHGRRLAPAELALLSKYPFLEHPEMVLALVPQEALSSAFETDLPTR